VGVFLIDFIVAEEFVLGEFLVKLVLKELRQLDFGLGDDPLVELHLRSTLAVKHHGFFAYLMNEIHPEPDQFIEIRPFSVTHSSSCLRFWIIEISRLKRLRFLIAAGCRSYLYKSTKLNMIFAIAVSGQRIKNKDARDSLTSLSPWHSVARKMEGFAASRLWHASPSMHHEVDFPVGAAFSRDSRSRADRGWKAAPAGLKKRPPFARDDRPMSSNTPTRDTALALLREFNQNESLIKHALAVEAVMRHFARKRGADEEKWGIIGLIHDLDYEKFPDQHCRKTEEILRERQWPEEYIRAVVSHGWGICSDVKPESEMEKVLFAVDELTGLVTTSALVRPSKSVLDMEASSVKKKWKDKRFAAGVDRSIIEKGVAMLGMDLTALITDTILGMRQVAEDIGLKGSVAS
jgi:putative nucleotidyltransferase with HDIG domain